MKPNALSSFVPGKDTKRFTKSFRGRQLTCGKALRGLFSIRKIFSVWLPHLLAFDRKPQRVDDEEMIAETKAYLERLDKSFYKTGT